MDRWPACSTASTSCPPFPSSGDRGFAPLTYTEIDPRFGSWADIERIAQRHDVLLDLMINHISRSSPQFRDFLRRGRRSPFADLFITLDKVWPNGEPPADDVARIFLRKPNAPFSTVTIEETGEEERIWTSFGTADWSEQIDLDVTSRRPVALDHRLASVLRRPHGVRIVRLDAVGYVIKKPGTTCFMVEPEIYDFLDWVTEVAESVGLVVLPEVHDSYATHERLAAHGFWTYDFVLPGLLLRRSARDRPTPRGASQDDPRNGSSRCSTATTGSRCDRISTASSSPGDARPGRRRSRERGGNVNRILSDAHAAEVDVHQLNCTYYSALGEDDDRYVAARAIQLFARGVPQVYYVGLLAGENDRDAVDAPGEGRAINRHDYSIGEIEEALRRPVVRRILKLVRLRARIRPSTASCASRPTETLDPPAMARAERNWRSRSTLATDAASDRGSGQ